MEWLFFIGGAVALIAVKGFVSWLQLLMKIEEQRREIKRLNFTLNLYGARNSKLESMWLEAEAKAENAGEIWPDIIS